MRGSDVHPLAGLVDVEAMPWVEVDETTCWKLLWVSEETGAWTYVAKVKAGTVVPRHVHLGVAEVYVIAGSIEYRGGHAPAGSWILEPASAVHDATTFTEDTVYLASVRGPIAELGSDGSVVTIIDGFRVRDSIAALSAV